MAVKSMLQLDRNVASLIQVFIIMSENSLTPPQMSNHKRLSGLRVRGISDFYVPCRPNRNVTCQCDYTGI